MGSTFFGLHYHLVFSTRKRRHFIKPEWRPRLHSYLGGIIKGMNGVPEIVGGVEDHVDILASLRPVHCLADVLRDLHRKHSFVDELRELLSGAGIEFDEKYPLGGLAPLRGAGHHDDFSGGLRGPPTTGYFLATLRVALG